MHWRVIVPEPTSSGVAGAAAFKAAGGAAAGGALLATIVVMLMTPPRSMREWAVGLISTVVTGIGGGAIVRWVVDFIERNRDAGIDEVAKEVKEVL